MTVKWNITQEMSTVNRTQVFSGGACNILSAEGKLLRNTERDPINDWLTEKGIQFFDPQIHPDTHGCEYDFAVHMPLEVAARRAAKINLYEVSPRTFGGITSFEIAADQLQELEPVVIYYSDGDPDTDRVPSHSDKGHPLFVPHGIDSSEQSRLAHYHEFVKNGNRMRKYMMAFARRMDTLTVTFSDTPRDNDVVITPERIHAADMFKAIVMASSNMRVFVTFTGGEKARDEKGNPLFIVPESPPEVELRALLDQYVDGGNALRRAIAELIGVSVFVRVVYTQRSAILALEEMLQLEHML
jgi:hypothetical protein